MGKRDLNLDGNGGNGMPALRKQQARRWSGLIDRCSSWMPTTCENRTVDKEGRSGDGGGDGSCEVSLLLRFPTASGRSSGGVFLSEFFGLTLLCCYLESI